MKTIEPPRDSKLGMLEARLRFWSSVPGADAMRAKLEAEIAAHGQGSDLRRASSPEPHIPTPQEEAALRIGEGYVATA